jgi:hypothetical protein
MGRSIISVVVVACAACWPGTGAAEGNRHDIGLAGDVGFGALGGKAYSTVQAGVDIQEGNLALGLFGRVRFLIQSSDDGEVVRRRDWDEVTDFLHILRYVTYSRQFGSVGVEVRGGELLGTTLGHGTLVRDYTNVANIDHPHSGIGFHVRHRQVDVQGLVDNIVRPAVVGTRVGVRPIKKLQAFEVGASLVMDPMAPDQVIIDAQGQRAVDRAWNLQYYSAVLALLGVDLSYTFGDPKQGTLKPYLDVNTSFYGAGLHLGVLGRYNIAKHGVRLGLQLEYRGASEGYAPGHIDTFYDLERYQAGLTFTDPHSASQDHREPKLAGLKRGIYGGHGALVQAGLEVQRLGRLKLGFAHRPGPDANSLWLRLGSRPIRRLNLGLLLVLRGVGGPHDDANGVVAVAEGRFRITDYLYALTQYSRSWSLREDIRYFGILQSFNIGVGGNWSS